MGDVTKKVVDLLNALFDQDREAVEQLINNRVEISDTILGSEDPVLKNVQVWQETPDGPVHIGLLGVLNGLTEDRICAITHEGKLQGFGCLTQLG